MNIHTRRLMADYEKICYEFAGHKNISVKPLEGNPPNRYLVTYNLKGLKLDKAKNCPVETNFHKVEIYLHREYPREEPQLKMLTEIFHPNFGATICITDYWTAGERLSDVILQIGEMIQYRNYNPKSARNAIAARWAMDNEHLFPIDNVDLYQPEPDVALANDRKSGDGGLDIELF